MTDSRALRLVLALSIVILSPGLSAYQAAAADMGAPGPSVEAVPAGLSAPLAIGQELPVQTIPSVPNIPGVPVDAGLNAPQLPASAQTALPEAVPAMPAAQAGLSASPAEAEPQATAAPAAEGAPQAQPAATETAEAPRSQAPGTLAGAEKLAAAVAPQGQGRPGSAAAQGSLDRAYTGSGAAPAQPEAVAVSGKDDACPSGGCPFARLFGKSNRGGSGNNGGNGSSGRGTPAPQRPAPTNVSPLHRAAMRLMAGIWWVADRALNSRWDKLPPVIGDIYLYFNEQYLRLQLWDASAQPSTDKTTYGKATAEEQKFRTADGSYFDTKDPAMAKAGARFNQLRKPAGPPNPNWAAMDPNPLELSEKLMARPKDAQGNPIMKEIPANSWFLQIQDQVHDWFNHEQRPMSDNPVSFTIPKGHPLAPEGGTMVLNRTQTDPTVPADYQGPAIHRNGETSPWDKSSLYGSSPETQAAVRTGKDGHLKLGEDGYLQDDPSKPGVPLTGFNNNMSLMLSMHNIIWAHEHNLVADAINREYRARGVQLSDEELFQKARLRITAANARNHTIPWTQWLLHGSAILQRGMWADWYGFVNKRFKLAYMRWTDRHPLLAKLTDPFIRSELLFGIPGTSTQHYGIHYNFVEEFVDVYRLHQLIRDTYKVHHLEPNADGTVTISVVDDVKLRDMVGVHTQDALRKHTLEDWGLTMGMQQVGELTLNNFPEDLRHLTAQDGVKDGAQIDLAAVDIIRTRERLEASTYVKFTTRLGERAPRTFEELTGGDKEAADKLRAMYKSVNDVDFQIGILAERKPFGFTLGNRQFKVFVVSAPARLKNDRFLSSQYSAKTYDQSGIDYVETNNWANIVARVIPGLKALEIEAMDNPYRPYAGPGWLPGALAQDSLDAQGSVAKASAWAWGMAGLGVAGLALAGLLSPLPVIGIAASLILGGRGLSQLMTARAAMTSAATASQADAAAAQAARAASLTRTSAAVAAVTTLAMALSFGVGAPFVAAGLALAGLVAARSLRRSAQTMADRVALQGVELKARLAKANPDAALGASAETAADLYNALGLKAETPDQAEVERIFRDFGALRGYVTAYDLARLREANQWRDAQAGRGTILSRWKARRAAKAGAERLVARFADRVVWEDGLPGGRVPAISQERLEKLLAEARPQGAAAQNQRLLSAVEAADGRLTKATLVNAGVSLAAAVALMFASAPPLLVGVLAMAPLFGALASLLKRAAAKAALAQAAAGQDKPFTALFSAEKLVARANLAARLGALASMDLGGMLAWKLALVDAPVAAALAAAVVTGWLAWRGIKDFSNAVALARPGVYGELKAGAPQIPIDALRGRTALERHGYYFSGGKEVAKFWTTYHYVRATGLGVLKSLSTAASWHLFFSAKTQKNMTPEERAEFKPGRFDNYIPNFSDAQGPTNTRIFAMQDIPGGPKRGDVDMAQFNRLFDQFAPGRDYLTKKDLARIWQANARRDWATTTPFSRFIGKIAFNKRFNQLYAILADRVATEDGAQVPAISRAGLLRYYQGGASYDLLRERNGQN